MTMKLQTVQLDSNKTYNAPEIVERLKKSPEFSSAGRLTSERLALAIGELRKRGARCAHLVVPIHLIPTVDLLLRSELLSQLVDSVWIDDGLDFVSPNWPWFVVADSEIITGEEEADPSKIFLGMGFAP